MLIGITAVFLGVAVKIRNSTARITKFSVRVDWFVFDFCSFKRFFSYRFITI